MHYTLEEKKSWTCVEFLTISSGAHTKFKLHMFPSTEKVTFFKDLMSENHEKYVRKKGINIFKSCDDLSNYPKDLWLLIKAFAGGQGLNPVLPIIGSKIWEYQLNANIDMIKELSDYEWKKRDKFHFLKFPKELARSGDVVLITRFDGLDQIIQGFCGSRAGHSTIVLRKGHEVFICESQVAEYFPRENIQCNNWDTWMKWAENADYNVVFMPL